MVVELQQVIGGAGSALTTTSAPKIGGPADRRTHIAHAGMKKPAVHLQKPASPKSGKTAGPKVTKPEEIIPLEDGDNLKEF